MTPIKTIASHKSFAGTQLILQHHAKATNTPMQFGLFLPPQASAATPVPVLYWLSGLTCTEENFVIKAGAQRVASTLGMAIVTPDTSPRGLNLPEGNDAYDFGSGASFYVDAIRAPWDQHYQMYTYVAEELPALVAAHFPIQAARTGIFGHSMGGHGALTIALKRPDYFKSVSAFAPICSPIHCPWGQKALTGYLGTDQKRWQAYDAAALITDRGWQGPPLLIDQGSADPYLETQLKPELLQAACKAAHVPLNYRLQMGYDHSYFFVATFIEDHLRFHADALLNTDIKS